MVSVLTAASMVVGVRASAIQIQPSLFMMISFDGLGCVRRIPMPAGDVVLEGESSESMRIGHNLWHFQQIRARFGAIFAVRIAAKQTSTQLRHFSEVL